MTRLTEWKPPNFLPLRGLISIEESQGGDMKTKHRTIIAAPHPLIAERAIRRAESKKDKRRDAKVKALIAHANFLKDLDKSIPNPADRTPEAIKNFSKLRMQRLKALASDPNSPYSKIPFLRDL